MRSPSRTPRRTDGSRRRYGRYCSGSERAAKRSRCGDGRPSLSGRNRARRGRTPLARAAHGRGRRRAGPGRGSRGAPSAPRSCRLRPLRPVCASRTSGPRVTDGSEPFAVIEQTTPRIFTSRMHDERNAAILGVALGVTFTVCFVTGELSHLIQDPPSWFQWPSRPAGLYRVTQGVHVATGLASIPLLLAKLWVVLPKRFAWPPFTSAAHVVERLAIFPLVAGGVFELFTGLSNTHLWYPWPFNFRSAHYWVAWIT